MTATSISKFLALLGDDEITTIGHFVIHELPAMENVEPSELAAKGR